jgi:uncharacterized protein
MMRNPITSLTTLVFIAFLALTSLGASAAEKKIVLQISDNDPDKQTLVLNVANNLLKAYKPGEIKMEVVAFGPGLLMLFEDNANKDRVQSLAANDVRFSACQNTVKGMTRVLGHPPKLMKEAVHVDAGVVRIIELTEQGYTLIRP